MKTLQHCDIFYIHYYKTSGYDNGASMTASLIGALGMAVGMLFSYHTFFDTLRGVAFFFSKIPRILVFLSLD